MKTGKKLRNLIVPLFIEKSSVSRSEMYNWPYCGNKIDMIHFSDILKR